MQRPRRRRVTRCLEYNNGMLPEEEIALRRALHASLVSKTADDEEPKQTKVKQQDKDGLKNIGNLKKRQTKSNAEPVETKENSQRIKRKLNESVETDGRKRQKKLLVQIKSKAGKEKARSNHGKGVVEKKVVKSKTGKKKTTVNENEGKVKRRRRRKKNVDAMKDDGINIKSSESLAKVHVQRKFAQINPTSPRSLLLFQSQMQPMTTRAKTEDFLDFLCLRGSTCMPKSLEMFNNPCAPMSPLTDEEESNKTTPSKTTPSNTTPSNTTPSNTTPSNEKNDNEPDAKRSLVMQLGEGQSSSSSSSLVSSPISIRVRSHHILPEFTNNHGVLTHIPTPIPYPPTPTKQPGFDVYGALSTNPVTPSLVPSQPRVSAVVMATHMSPDKQGFHPVSQSGWDFKDTEGSSPQMVGETCSKASKSPKQSPSKMQDNYKSPGKRDENGQGKSPKDSPNKGPGKKITSPKKSLKYDGKQESSKTSKNMSTDASGSLADGTGSTNTNCPNLDSVPVFTPTDVEFKNPLKYIESIKSKAEPFGICLIVPPKTWKPDYCLSDEIRFTTKLQRIHCLGKNYPTVEDELAAIRKHLEQQNILLSAMPQISGCEVDLPFMCKVVEEFGGLQQIIDRRKWVKVADRLRIPRTVE